MKIIFDYCTEIKDCPVCTLEEHEKYCFNNEAFQRMCREAEWPNRVLIREPDGSYCWCICGGP